MRWKIRWKEWKPHSFQGPWKMGPRVLCWASSWYASVPRYSFYFFTKYGKTNQNIFHTSVYEMNLNCRFLRRGEEEEGTTVYSLLQKRSGNHLVHHECILNIGTIYLTRVLANIVTGGRPGWRGSIVLKIAVVVAFVCGLAHCLLQRDRHDKAHREMFWLIVKCLKNFVEMVFSRPQVHKSFWGECIRVFPLWFSHVCVHVSILTYTTELGKEATYESFRRNFFLAVGLGSVGGDMNTGWKVCEEEKGRGFDGSWCTNTVQPTTNHGIRAEPQQIVAQRLLSCLQHPVPIKSSTEDLSQPSFCFVVVLLACSPPPLKQRLFVLKHWSRCVSSLPAWILT